MSQSETNIATNKSENQVITAAILAKRVVKNEPTI
jgi:hypothetical protein